MSKPGRNDPCHCGSGKKFKNCHGKTGEGGKKTSDRTLIYIALFVVFLAMAIYGAYVNSQSPGSARPDGPAPPGKVWSEEHGHWHDR